MVVVDVVVVDVVVVDVVVVDVVVVVDTTEQGKKLPSQTIELGMYKNKLLDPKSA